MSNYVKSTNFAIKDSLVTTDPAKIIKGTDIDNEYNAISNAIASKADTNSPALTGSPTAPTATIGTNTTQIATCAFAIANGIPSGCIVMWSGTIASIPSGWVLCNGSSGTPDLRDRFIIGASSDDASVAKTNITGALTKSGGSKDAIVVSHAHTATSTDSGHSHSGGATGSLLPVNNVPYYNFNQQGNTGIGYANITTTVNSTGESGTNANLPPYFALAFIMKS